MCACVAEGASESPPCVECSGRGWALLVSFLNGTGSQLFFGGAVPLVAVVSLRKGSSEPPTHRLRLEELINSSIRFQFLHDGGARRSLVIFLT